MSSINDTAYELSGVESLYPKNVVPEMRLPYSKYETQAMQLPYPNGSIGTDTFAFASAIHTMNSAAQNISQISVEWISQGEESKVFDDYVQKLRQLELIFQKYGELAKKDTRAVKSISESIEAIDNESILLW